jgi:quercetin dioxygenase-like cupin family protein
VSRHAVHLHGEQSYGALAIAESTIPAGAAGPPLHSHAFDEAFYVLEGELTFQLEEEVMTAHSGELIFAPRGVPHTLANQSAEPARFLLVFAPAGFEREIARRTARETGTETPPWALQPIPQVSYLGPPIGQRQLRS